MGLTEQEKELIKWLKKKDEYYVDIEEVKREFPDVELNITGVTVKLDDKGKSMYPRIDIIHAIKYGYPKD